MEDKGRNSESLTLVTVFHYVVGSFQLLMSLLGVFYIGMGILMGSGQLESAKSSAPPEAVAWIFGTVGAVIMVIFLVLGGLTLRAGSCIRKRKNRMFCLVVDAILCMFIPFGTVAGVFGLVMLTRPEVEEQFS